MHQEKAAHFEMELFSAKRALAEAEKEIAALKEEIALLKGRYDPDLLASIEKKKNVLLYKGIPYIPQADLKEAVEKAKAGMRSHLLSKLITN